MRQQAIQIQRRRSFTQMFFAHSELMDNQNQCKIKNNLIKCWFRVITRWWFFLCFQEPRQDIRLRPLNILPHDERETCSFFYEISFLPSKRGSRVHLCKSWIPESVSLLFPRRTPNNIQLHTSTFRVTNVYYNIIAISLLKLYN